MSNLKYKISQVDGQILEGDAERVFIKDSLNIMTIKAGHAPLIAILSKGSIRLDLLSQENLELEYEEGMLTCKNGQIDVSLIQ